MNRCEVEEKIIKALKEEFKLDHIQVDESLVDQYEFDSVDALNLLTAIEQVFEFKKPLSIQEERRAMEMLMVDSTVNHIVDYVVELIKNRE